MKIKTNDLSDIALDWSVAKASYGMRTRQIMPGGPVHIVRMSGAVDALPYSPSTDRSRAEPIIEREKIAVWPDDESSGFLASSNEGRGRDYHGPTRLVAAMRCYVASELGDEVDVPDELMGAAAQGKEKA